MVIVRFKARETYRCSDCMIQSKVRVSYRCGDRMIQSQTESSVCYFIANKYCLLNHKILVDLFMCCYGIHYSTMLTTKGVPRHADINPLYCLFWKQRYFFHLRLVCRRILTCIQPTRWFQRCVFSLLSTREQLSEL